MDYSRSKYPHIVRGTSDRERAVLTAPLAELESKGLNPWENIFVVQVDQNFKRCNYLRSNPSLCPCLLPNGKYILTSRWRFVSGKAASFLLSGQYFETWGGGQDCQLGWDVGTLMELSRKLPPEPSLRKPEVMFRKSGLVLKAV